MEAAQSISLAPPNAASELCCDFLADLVIKDSFTGHGLGK